MYVEQRVKFYSKSDFCYFDMLKKTLNILKNYKKDKEDYNFNDILELFNVTKYLEEELTECCLMPEEKVYFNQEIKRDIWKGIGFFCSRLNESKLIELTHDIYPEYLEDYWTIFEKFKIYERISGESFKQVLEVDKFPLWVVLSYEKLVEKYDYELCECLLNDFQSVDLLINKYLKADRKQNIYLPRSLTPQKKEQIVINYINSPYVDFDILEILYSMPPNNEFNISNETRLKAEKRCKLAIEEFWADKNTLKREKKLIVRFSDSQAEGSLFNYDIDKVEIIISENWIEKNLDFSMLLNSFLYIIPLVDAECRMINISKTHQLGIFEKEKFINHFNKQYIAGTSFEMFNSFAISTVKEYCEHLNKRYNIRIEDVLQWFYDRYLPDEFGVKDFIVNMPSIGSTYLEKCRSLCGEMESTFKQYDTLCRYGFINHDLIEIASTPIIIKDVKSVIKNKYIYPNYKECKESCFLLFSDQSMLTYLSQRPLKNEYPCLFYLILNGKVNMSEYQEYQKALINRLIEEEVIFLDENGFLQFTNLFDILIMKDLYENEFAVRAFYCNKKVVNIFSESLERLRKKNWIYFGEGLFSTQESEYFNYYLNKKEYFNGLDLRNKYLHGTQRKKGDDEKLHTDNYYTLLMLFIILTIKIRDDLCQKDIVKEEKETNV